MESEALIAMFEGYIAAWRQGDAKTCISFYANDARMDDPLLPEPLEGRRHIEAYFVQGFAERPADTTRKIVNIGLGENRLFFEWTISSAAGGSKGISVWDVDNAKVVWDRSYWYETE